MGKEEFFFTVYNTDEDVVKQKWKEMCEEEKVYQRNRTLQTIHKDWPANERDEALRNFDKIHKEYLQYSESPYSFDEYKYGKRHHLLWDFVHLKT